MMTRSKDRWFALYEMIYGVCIGGGFLLGMKGYVVTGLIVVGVFTFFDILFIRKRSWRREAFVVICTLVIAGVIIWRIFHGS